MTLAADAGPPREYPYWDGDIHVLGPSIFASADGRVICWNGQNYVSQEAADRAIRSAHGRGVEGAPLDVGRVARP